MKKQRILACLLASALVLSVGASAANPDVVEVTGEPDGAGKGGGVSVVGEGETTYVSPKQFSVILPTANAFSFKLDPQGLLNAEEGSEESLEDLKANGGRIKFDNKATIINNSAVPITVTAAISVTGGATHLAFPTTTADNFPKNAGAMLSGAGTELAPFAKFDESNLLSYGEIKDLLTTNNSVANTVSVFASPGKSSINTADENSTYLTCGYGYVLGSAATTFKFVLDAANYTYDTTNKKFKFTEESGNGTMIKLGGYANPNADWDVFTQAPTIPKTVAAADVTKFTTANSANTATWAKETDITKYKMYVSAGADKLATAGAAIPTAALTAAKAFVKNTAAPLKTGFQAWSSVTNADNPDPTNVIYLPTAITSTGAIGTLVEQHIKNAAAKTIGVTATFRFVEASLADQEAAKKPFALGGKDGTTHSLTADGYAFKPIDGDVIKPEGWLTGGKVDEAKAIPIAYGLMGLSVNNLKMIKMESGFGVEE